MPVLINEHGEFVYEPAFDPDENRERVYAGLIAINPRRVDMSEPRLQTPLRKIGEKARCEECGAEFERKTRTQRFCSIRCQKENYNAEQREARRIRREMRP